MPQQLQKILVFVGMYLGYSFYTLNRKSFSFIIPQVTAEGEITALEAGKILSSFSLAYTIGKFVCGILVDNSSPKWMFSLGLFCCGAVNLLFTVSSSEYFVFLWFLNGLCQGPGWPACTKLLNSWFSPASLGTLWSLLSTCMNVAAGIGPLFASWYLQGKDDSHWRLILQVFGSVSILLSLLFLLVKDKPRNNDASFYDNEEGSRKNTNDVEVENVWKTILTTPYFYVLGTSYMSSLFIKGAVTDWGTSYLIQEKSATTFSSGKVLATIEIGGILGRIISGFMSDFIVAFMGKKPQGHPRHWVVITEQLVLTLLMYTLRVLITDINEQSFITLFVGFGIGFCLYGSISLVGLLSIENSTSSISGTTHAFCALLGNIGLVMAGYPFSYLASVFSWTFVFQIAELFTAMSFVSFLSFQWRSCYIGPRPKTL